MIRAIDRYDQWLTDVIAMRCPELVEPIRSAIETYDAADRHAHPEKLTLRPLVEAACSHRRPEYELATTLLGDLAAKYRVAQDEVTAMAANRKAQIRFNAILCLNRDMPDEYVFESLRLAISDKSKRVRSKAADWALRLRLTSIAPEIQKQIMAETDEQVKRGLDYCLPLIRDGFKLAQDQHGYKLTVVMDDGTKSCRVTQQEINELGIERLVAEKRKPGYSRANN